MAKKLLSLALYCMMGLLVAGLVLLVSNPPRGKPLLLLPTLTLEDLVVYVTGEVTHPGVYTFPPGSRLDAAIAAAGGFSPSAAEASVNLASPLHDGQAIHVPSLEDQETTSSTLNQQGIISSTGQIDINIASMEDLQNLPGIGPTKAEAIVKFRETNGPFRSKQDLLLVPGIGEATLSQIEDYILINP
jgi:competence protein ComEA